MSDYEINDGVLVKYNGANCGTAVIPDGVKAISDDAFNNQGELTEIQLPDGLETIGIRAFAGAGIKTITIPPTVESIGGYAFYGCYRLKEVIVSDGVTKIGESVFAGAADLKRVVLPASVENIAGAFKGHPLDDVPSLKAADVVVMPEIAQRTSTKDQLSVSLIPCLSDNVDALANVLAYQNHANWIKAVEANCGSGNAGQVFAKAIALVPEEDELTAKKASQLVAFALNHFSDLDCADIATLHALLKGGGKKLSKPLVQLEGDPRAKDALAAN